MHIARLFFGMWFFVLGVVSLVGALENPRLLVGAGLLLLAASYLFARSLAKNR